MVDGAVDPRSVDKLYSIKQGMAEMLADVLYGTALKKKAFYRTDPIQTWDYESIAGPRAARVKLRAGLDGGRLYGILTDKRMAALRAFFSPNVIPGWNLPADPSVEWEGDSIVIDALYPHELQLKMMYLDFPGERASMRAKDGVSAILGLTDSWKCASIFYSGMDAHGMLVGQSGGGKTTTIETILGQIARSEKAQIAIIDGKGKGPESLENLSTLNGLIGPIAYSIEEAMQVIDFVTREMARRDTKEACQSPFHLVVDEFHVYTQVPEISRWLDDFGRRARSKNMHLTVGTQRSDTNVWGIAGATLQGQFGNVLLHRMMSYNDVKTVTGNSYPPAHALAGEGDIYHKSTRHGVQRVQVGLLTKNDYDKVLGHDPGTAWETQPETDGRFSCRQQVAAIYVASIHAADNRRGGRGTLQTLLEQINEEEKSNQVVDDLLALGRTAYYSFKEVVDV